MQKKIIVSTGALALLASTASLSAQTLDEVVVTAQRRAESTQETPVAITGLSQEALGKFGFESANDISAQVPNMQVSGPYGEVQPIFSIRGVSMSDYSSNQASPIGVYTDEAYLGSVFIHGMSFFDVERLEVLRGPQGTLYGKNTTGGAINIITRTPAIGDDWTVNIKGGYGANTALGLDGGFGGTVIKDRLAMRLAFKYKRDDGYFENALGGDDLGQVDFLAGRAVVNWQVTDAFNAVLKYTHGKNKARATPPRNEPRTDVRGFEDANPNAPYPTNGFIDYTGYDRNARGLDFFETEDNRSLDGENILENIMDLAVMTLTYEFDKFSLVSVTSYYDAFYEQQANTDGSPLRLLEIDWHTDTQAISQDFRFVSDFDGPIQIIGGLYYGFEDTYMHNTYEIYQDLVDFRAAIAKPEISGNAPFVLDFGAVDQRQATEKETFAAYAQTRWDITQDLGMDFGIRFTQDVNRQTYLNISRIGYDGAGRGSFVPGNTSGNDAAFTPVPVPVSILTDPAQLEAFLADPSSFGIGVPVYNEGPYTLDSAPELSATEREWTGKIGVDYHLNEDLMAYAAYSQGYRSGSFNGGVYYQVRPLETAYAAPEYISAYELGLKADMFDNSMRINSALFYYDYTDQQFINVVGISNFLENAGSSQIMGLETEIWWAATERLTLQMGLGLLHSEYSELELRNTETIANLEDTIDLSGNELISAPKVNLSLSVDFDMLVTNAGTLSLNANSSFQSHQWYSAYNEKIGYDKIEQDAYWLFNSRITWYGANDHYQISIWGKNLLNEEYDSYAINLQGGFGYDYYSSGPARTFGLDMTFRY